MPEASTPMVLGHAAAAPTGYLDFCRRQPEDCGGAPAPVVRKVAEIELARRGASETQHVAAFGPRASGANAQQVNWAEAFAEAKRRREMAAASNAAVEAAMASLQTQAAPASAGLQKASYNVSAETLTRTVGSSASTAPAVAERPAMTQALWTTITKVNDKVNRALVRRSDLEAYGAMDHWATPLADGRKFGDCEDYVLEKRRALIAEGLPASALSIAVATTNWGERHAVLIVETDQGAYVLDSLTPWILPWRKANLFWHERQVAGAPFRWSLVDVAARVEPAPALPARLVTAQAPATAPMSALTPATAPTAALAPPPAAEPLQLALSTGPLALRGRL